jgi:hypothetical protein
LARIIGGAAFLRGGGATEDIAYMQNSGRDELHYCGTGAVCSKLLNSDTNLYVNSLVPMTINAGGVGTNARPFPSIFLGTAATNNIAITPTAMAAARTITVNDPLANATLRTEISGTDTTDLASVANGACSPDSGAITVTGARAGDEIHVTAATVLETGGYLIGRVTANNAGRVHPSGHRHLRAGALGQARRRRHDDHPPRRPDLPRRARPDGGGLLHPAQHPAPQHARHGDRDQGDRRFHDGPPNGPNGEDRRHRKGKGAAH